jgi:hypothetical protein
MDERDRIFPDVLKSFFKNKKMCNEGQKWVLGGR